MEERGLLARKPGGFIWVRAGFRKTLLEEAEFARDKNREAEIHIALVLWHRRVLAATKAPSAVFEAVYHSIAAASVLSKIEGRDQDVIYNINCAKNLLQEHAFLIQTLGYAFANIRILHQYIIDSDLGTGVVREAWGRFRAQCADISRCIARELGEYRMAYIMHGEALSIRLQGTPAGRSEKGLKPGLRNRDKLVALCFVEGKPADLESWVCWWRWTLMLAIATRAAVSADSILRRCLAMNKQYERTVNRTRVSVQAAIDWWQAQPRSASSPSAHAGEAEAQFLRLLEQVISSRIEHLRMRRRISVIDPADLAEVIVDVEVAVRFVHRHIAEMHERTKAHWCLARLYVHHSSLAVLLAETEEKPDPVSWNKAMALLNNASSYLQFSVSERETFDRAAVELCRGDAKLRNAERLFPNGENLKACSALLSEGLHYFSRAENVLSRRRRNVWWSTWYFERMLSAISLAVRIAEKEERSADSVPYFGFELVHTNKSTLADELLYDSLRMIRSDPFRIATILDAYQQIIETLQKRPQWEPLHPYALGMAQRLRSALIDLANVQKRRASFGEGGLTAVNAALHPDARVYVDRVRDNLCLHHRGR